MKNKTSYFLLFFMFLSLYFFSQTDSSLVISFDFNEHQLKETNNKLAIKPVGVTLVADRFGNESSAAYFHGNANSYINLGTSDSLKPKQGTISLWVNMQNAVFSGKGYNGNPILIIKNGPGEDFIIGCGIAYSFETRRFSTQTSKDSLLEVTAFSKDHVTFCKWYHLAITYNNSQFTFYINGELQGKFIKGFESHFLKGDSVILGRSTGHKNERFTHAIFDDIKIYHRVLNEQEILNLYHEPNPNHMKNMLFEALKYGAIILILCIIIIIILIRNKRNLKKQKEYYELHNKIKELEIKVIKTQMNPHFISNCLSAIQNLIYSNQIDAAGEYLAKFSFFLRQILDFSDKIYLTLEEELAIIKMNIELEQLRFTNNFIFELKIDDSIALQDILIPSLITQPFIENAVWHGLLPLKNSEPRLTVSIYRQNNLIYITIEDNGVGRDNAEILTAKNQEAQNWRPTKLKALIF